MGWPNASMPADDSFFFRSFPFRLDAVRLRRSREIMSPSAYGGYETRLFLDAPITLGDGRVPAVTTDVLCGRTMYAASWRGVPATVPLNEGILAHLRLYEGVAA